MGLKIGSEVVDLEVAKPTEEKKLITRLTFDANKEMPILVSREEYEMLATRLHLPQLLQMPEEKKGKKWIDFVRASAKTLGRIFVMIVGHPDFTRGGVSVGYVEETS